MKASFKDIYSMLKKALKNWWVKDLFRESAIEAFDELKPIAIIIG